MISVECVGLVDHTESTLHSRLILTYAVHQA